MVKTTGSRNDGYPLAMKDVCSVSVLSNDP